MPRLTTSIQKEWGLRFNGTTQGAQSAATLNLTGTDKITLTYWIKQNASTGSLQVISETSSSYGLHSGTFLSLITTSNTLAFAIVGNGGNTEWYTQPIVKGQWYFVAFTCDLTKSSATALKGYVNGALSFGSAVTTGPTPVGTNFDNEKLNIGARNNGASLFSAISLKDMRIYSSILTPAQIQTMYEQGPNVAFGSSTSWYKMNDGTSTTLVDSGSALNNQAIVGRTTTGASPSTMWVIDPVRPPRLTQTSNTQSVLFNGTSDRISIPDATSLNMGTGNFTIEAKVYIEKLFYNFITDKIDLASGNGWQLFTGEPIVNAVNRITMWLQQGVNYMGVSNFNTFIPGQWYHVIASVTRNDVTQYKIFQNGICDPVYSGTADYSNTTGSISNAEPLDIGHRKNAAGLFIKGGIYDVRLYNRALTDDECLSRYYTNENITSGRVSWWKMNEGSGTTIADSQGTNNGTITGGTWTLNTMS